MFLPIVKKCTPSIVRPDPGRVVPRSGVNVQRFCLNAIRVRAQRLAAFSNSVNALRVEDAFAGKRKLELVPHRCCGTGNFGSLHACLRGGTATLQARAWLATQLYMRRHYRCNQCAVLNRLFSEIRIEYVPA